MTLKNALTLLLSGLYLLTLPGCEVATSARLGAGPSFSFDGSGRLASFTIYGPQSGHKIATPYDDKSQVWSIQPSNGFPDSILVARLNLVYGSLPKGYTQTVPHNGSAPSLSTGVVYYFIAETTGAPWAQGFFYMDKTGPVRIAVPGLCPSAFVGDVKPLKCGTSEPYVEPKDLEKFVQENRVQK
jgi:hypothetical protein